MKLFGVVFFACSMFFVAYVILGSSPLERMSRGCLPVEWGGRAATTVAAVFSEGAEGRMRIASTEAYEGCRFFLFRQFYAEKLRELRDLEARGGEPLAPEGGRP